MKSIITVLLLATVIIFETGCSSCERSPTDSCGEERVFEGWAGPPENVKQKPFEYYYMKRVSRASPYSRERHIGTQMQKICTERIILTGKPDFMRKVIGESLTGAEGVSDGESTGKVVVAEFSGKVKGLNTRECKPLHEKQPEYPGIEWEDCLCIVYARVPGGKDAIVTRAVEIGKNRKK